MSNPAPQTGNTVLDRIPAGSTRVTPSTPVQQPQAAASADTARGVLDQLDRDEGRNSHPALT